MNFIETDAILEIITKFCHDNKISLSRYAYLAGVSKSWISRLMTEEDKKISLELAQRLLLVAGYNLKITKAQVEIKKINRLGKR